MKGGDATASPGGSKQGDEDSLLQQEQGECKLRVKLLLSEGNHLQGHDEG